MYLKKSKRKDGRVYLSIAEGYHDSERGHTRTVTVKSLGFLDELEKEYEDPIAHFQQVVREMNAEKADRKTPVTLSLDPTEQLPVGTSNRKNLGYAVLSQIYHDLGLHSFLRNRQRNLEAEFNSDSIMKLLVFSRLLYPASKKKTLMEKDRFFEKSDFSLDDVYRCLSFLNGLKEDVQLLMHKRIQEQYGRNTDLVYYDVTDYYLEVDEQDELRRRGVSKEHRPDPLVQMGLFMDSSGVPITYRLFPGNTVDKSTFIPMVRQIANDYSLGRVIVVADKGMTSGDNIWYTLSARNGYVFSYSIRGADQRFKDYVLDDTGYTWLSDDYKAKSRLYPRDILVSSTTGREMKKQVHEKQVIFYSRKYAEKAKADRAAALDKARKLVANPADYTRATSYGAAKYVKGLVYDRKTGEILTNAKNQLSVDEEKLRQEEELDGYYAIVTSEWKESDEKIIGIYRGLWKIEESFKATESDFETRPVYLSTEEHIEAHFLTCFIALVIARLLENKMNGKYSVTAMLDSLSKASCSQIQENYFIFDHYDEILEDMGKEFNIDFSKKYRRLGEIKKILGATKTGPIPQ